MRFSEHFFTFQGEGPNTGKPTQFLRLSGCNLRCPGWGLETTLPSGKIVTGCDTPQAVWPELYKNDDKLSAFQLSTKLRSWPQHVCITGGEPLMQPTDAFRDLIRQIVDGGYTLDIFTNGTYCIDKCPELWDTMTGRACTVVMDYKLAGSGEAGKFNWDNVEYLSGKDALKFVVADSDDYDEAKGAMASWKAAKAMRKIPTLNPRFYFGVVFGKLDPAEMFTWILKDHLDVTLNLQTHTLIGVDEKEREWLA